MFKDSGTAGARKTATLAGVDPAFYDLTDLSTQLWAFVLPSDVPERNMWSLLFKEKLRAWRIGQLSPTNKRDVMSAKEAAAVLDIDYPSYRKYECGKRTPCKLALAELERRMSERNALI